jgi:hypothetical protein
MTPHVDQRPRLRHKAKEITSKLSAEEREALLVRCWLSHDARWFMAVAQAFGLEAASRLNQTAAHEEGRAEARRVVRALGLGPVTTLDDWLTVQEALGSLLTPDLFDYQVVPIGDGAYELRIERCFAHENVTRAGVADSYECGILPRITGWLEALGVKYELTPAPTKCLKAQGYACVYTFRLEAPSG